MKSKLDAANSILRLSGLPTSWREHRTGELVRIISGGTPDRNESSYWREGKIPWITPTDLTAIESKHVFFGAQNITERGLSNCNATLLPRGTVVFSTRGSVGKMALAGDSLTINQSCEGLVPNKDKITSEFLFYLLQFGHSAFLRLSGGTTFGSITRRDIKRVKFAVPLKEEQKAIARILDSVDRAIERTQEAIEKSCKFQYSLLHEMVEGNSQSKRRLNLSDCKSWPIFKVGDVAEVGSGVTLGKDVSGFKSVELPYLRVANVQDGYLDLSSVKTVWVRLDEAHRYRLSPGDIVMTEGGDIDKLGRGAIWEGEISDCLHQNHIFRIRVNRDILNPYFFAAIVESNISKKYFFRVAKRTTNLASINKTQLKAFPFPIPPLSEQEKIVSLIQAAKAKTTALKQKAEALQELKRSLMHDLLTGKVRITHLNAKAPSENAP